jgi:hypothetical protein
MSREHTRKELTADLRRCAGRIDRIREQAKRDKAAALKTGRNQLAARIEADATKAIEAEQRIAREIEKDIRDYG